MVVWLCAYSLIVRLILCDLVPYLLCRGYIIGERSCVLLVCITQILSRGSLCGKSYVDDIVKILLCEGGDVEHWLESRNISLCLLLTHYILTLSLSLSYLPCIISYCSFIHICLVLLVCLTYVESRELYIAPQLLFRGI